MAQPIARLHLAIIHKPPLDRIMAGDKRLEFHLTQTRQPPFERAAAGETVILKQAGGPYRARAVIDEILFVEAGPGWPLERIREQFGAQIGAPEKLWEIKAEARYASLIWLRGVEAIGREDVPAEILALSVSRAAWRVVEVGEGHRLRAGANEKREGASASR